MSAPSNFAALLREWPAIQADIAFLRSLRNLRAVTASGDVPLLYARGSNNAAIDLRSLAPNGQPAAGRTGGDVVGPSSSVLDRIAVFADVTGKVIRDGGATIAQIDPRGRHSLWIPATLIRPSATGGCAALATTNSGGTVDVQTLDFDPTTAEGAQFGIVFPDNWDAGTLVAEFVWAHPATTVNFGVVWGISALSALDGENIAAAIGTEVLVADTGGATFRLYTTPESSLVAAAGTVATNGVVFFRVRRLPGDPQDTLAVDAKLIGVRLFFITDSPTEGTNPDPITYEAEVVTWMSLVASSSGTLAANSARIANDLMVALNAATYRAKIIYLLPLLGSNLAAARCPLIDATNAGIATNANFLDADFAQNLGLQGNGVNKSLDLKVKISQLGGGTNFGFGFWERAYVAANYHPDIGVTGNVSGGNSLHGIYCTPTQEKFFLQNPTVGTADIAVTVTPANHHYYAQRASSIDRKLYRNGVQIGANVVNDNLNTTITSAFNVKLMQLATDFSVGRAGVGYMTDGTMTPTDIAAFHTLLNTYLIVATGR